MEKSGDGFGNIQTPRNPRAAARTLEGVGIVLAVTTEYDTAGEYASVQPPPELETGCEIVGSAELRPKRQQTGVHNRKKGTACNRCRNQKTRCDNGQEPCTSCVRVNKPCIRPNLLASTEANDNLHRLEARLRSLEQSLVQTTHHSSHHALAPGTAVLSPGSSTGSFATSGPNPICRYTDDRQPDPVPVEVPSALRQSPFLNADGTGSSSPRQSLPSTTSPGTTTQITPNEPLAHEVGLLSLANSKESKYLGPSSGVPFARLILTAIPHSQGLHTSLGTQGGSVSTVAHPQPESFPPHWTFEVDLKHFVDAYFEVHQPLYPFLDEDAVFFRLRIVFSEASSALRHLQLPQIAHFERALTPVHSAQLFLVMALGARVLESRLSYDFSSERYLATALSRIDQLFLHESMEGLQIMLLLILCSFHFVDGPNAWFLTSNIIAACLDLGLQRQLKHQTDLDSHVHDHNYISQNVRKGIFWSAYSFERTIAVVLGRPLTLRDEAIDVEFPGSDNVAHGGENDDAQGGHFRGSKRMRVDFSHYTAAQHSFRFDQLTAEMKLMLYRVRNAPDCFPWLPNVTAWQEDAHHRCDELGENMLRELKWCSSRSGLDSVTRTLELKYHHCLMLLHRPSPAIPRPTLRSWRVCYHSAVQTILISADLKRFSKLNSTWLTAHAVFVSALTMLYCLWMRSEIKSEIPLTTIESNVAACDGLLRFFGKTWIVAANALDTFERLAQLSMSAWRTSKAEHGAEEMEAGQLLVSMNQPRGYEQLIDSFTFGGEDSGEMPFGGDGVQGFEPQLFLDELGDISAWFDLNWMLNNDVYGT